MDISMIMSWLGSILAFFAGILAGIALGAWRRHRNDSRRGISTSASASDAPRRESWSWGDTILVDTATGSYFFASDYLKCHSRMDLFGELARGHFVHEEKWRGMKGTGRTRLEVTEEKR